MESNKLFSIYLILSAQSYAISILEDCRSVETALSGTYMTTSFILVHQVYSFTRPDKSEPVDL